jgi:adenylate cyclase
LSDRIEEGREMVAALMKLEPNLTVGGYLARHPAGCSWTGKVWGEALRRAGVPA